MKDDSKIVEVEEKIETFYRPWFKLGIVLLVIAGALFFVETGLAIQVMILAVLVLGAFMLAMGSYAKQNKDIQGKVWNHKKWWEE